VLTAYINALVLILGLAFATWVYSLRRHDVSVVDSLWSLLFLGSALVYAMPFADMSARQWLVLTLVTVWALRLSLHLTVRNHGQPEDRRYRAIRRNNEPHFALKSLYLVFGLQGGLAWIISIPLLFALAAGAPFGWLDGAAVILWLVGFTFEAVADHQLLRFRADPDNRGRVLSRGLWRYSRHPNYFGEFCIWWAFYLLAVPAGGWWTFYAPLLMSFLLLKVSGVVMMEKDIARHRPEYGDYMGRTNAFFPGRPERGGVRTPTNREQSS